MLQMTPETMRELAHHVTEILVQRIDRLPGERVWEGDFKDALAQQLAEDPPAGAGSRRPGRAGRAAQYAEARPSAVVRLRADLPDVAGSAGRLPGVRVQRQRSHLAHSERPEPARGRGDRLVPAMVRTAERGGWTDD